MDRPAAQEAAAGRAAPCPAESRGDQAAPVDRAARGAPVAKEEVASAGIQSASPIPAKPRLPKERRSLWAARDTAVPEKAKWATARAVSPRRCTNSEDGRLARCGLRPSGTRATP